MSAAESLQAPGTVSQILWHFTGGPAWDNAAGKQSSTPKSAAAAYNALVGILETRELRVGAYKEIVKVRVEKVREWNRKLKRYEIKENVERRVESSPVSCLADIPIIHLAYHQRRYGQFAVGFHRDAAVAAGFNPVFYTLQNSQVIRSVHEGFAKTKATSLEFSRMILDEVKTRTAEAEWKRNSVAILTRCVKTQTILKRHLRAVVPLYESTSARSVILYVRVSEEPKCQS
jgi:hypothetical protein